MNNLNVVVGKANRRKRHRGKNRDPHKRIAQVRPQQRRHKNGNRNEQPAHRRSAPFFLMRLRPLFAYVLPNLKVAQPPNHNRPHDQPCKKRSKARKGSAESKITKNTKRRKIMEQLQVEQPVEQSASEKISCQLSAVSSQFLTPMALNQGWKFRFSLATSAAPSPTSRHAKP